MFKPQYVILFLIFVFLKSYSQQGNYKFNNFGNRSILLSGNVTGSVEDLGLTYYNPSRLTEVESTGFEFNAKAYQLTSFELKNLVGDESNLNSSNFNGVPSMAGAVFNLFGTRFAYSVISKSRFETDVGYSSSIPQNEIQEFFPDLDEYEISLGLGSNTRDDWTGLTWAKKINQKLSLGVSLFGSIYKYRTAHNIDQTITSTDDTVAFYQEITEFQQDSYGLIIKIGGNYHFSKFDLGINISVPYLELYSEGRFRYNKVISGVGSDYDEFFHYDLKDLNSKRKEPLSISLGAGVPVGKSKIHLNIDYVSGLSIYNRLDVPDIDTGKEEITSVFLYESRREVINFGVGAEVYINEKIRSFFSFSSDYNSFESNANVFDLSSIGNKGVNIGANFFHLALGINCKLSWISLILGSTYAKGSSDFVNPINFSLQDLDVTELKYSRFDYSRWQFVIGLEIPFFNQKKKELLD